MTLSWSASGFAQNQTFTTQTLLIDSDKSGLQTLILEGPARTVTLSSGKHRHENTEPAKLLVPPCWHAFRHRQTKMKSASLQGQHFYQLQAPQVTMVGVPDGIKLTFKTSSSERVRQDWC